jgi:hypothetical protein
MNNIKSRFESIIEKNNRKESLSEEIKKYSITQIKELEIELEKGRPDRKKVKKTIKMLKNTAEEVIDEISPIIDDVLTAYIYGSE